MRPFLHLPELEAASCFLRQYALCCCSSSSSSGASSSAGRRRRCTLAAFGLRKERRGCRPRRPRPPRPRAAAGTGHGQTQSEWNRANLFTPRSPGGGGRVDLRQPAAF